MSDIRDVIAKNLIDLRKKNNMTQNDLAKKLQYSDNTISRWEHAEITPSIETLQKISEIYGIEIGDLLKENITDVIEEDDKNLFINRFSSSLFSLSAVWLVAVIIFVYGKSIAKVNYWMSFIWAVPVSCLVLLSFNRYWKNKIYGFVLKTILIWSLLASVYLQFLSYNVYLIFIVGIPIQLAITILTFIKKQLNKKTSNKDDIME